MMELYTVCAIPADKIDTAHPVAELAAPGLELSAWRQHCRAVDGLDGQGRAVAEVPVLVALDSPGYVRGLCRLRQDDLEPGHRTVHATSFVIASLLDLGGVAAAMLRRLIEICGERHCRRLVISVPPDLSETLLALAQARDAAAARCGNLAIVLLAD
jgi:hypothetical protein